MTIAANAGPLMVLGKLGLVHLLRALDERIVIPSEVYEEVVTRGLELGQPDAYAVQLAVARDEIHVVHLQESDLSTVECSWIIKDLTSLTSLQVCNN